MMQKYIESYGKGTLAVKQRHPTEAIMLININNVWLQCIAQYSLMLLSALLT